MRMIGDWQRYGVNPEPHLENAEKWFDSMRRALSILNGELAEAKGKLMLNIIPAINVVRTILYRSLKPGDKMNYKNEYFRYMWGDAFYSLKQAFSETYYTRKVLDKEAIQSKKGKCMLPIDFENLGVTWDDIVRQLGFDPDEFCQSKAPYRSVALAKALIFCIDSFLGGALFYRYRINIIYMGKYISADASGDFVTGTVSLNDAFYAKRRTLTSQCHEAMLYGIANGMYEGSLTTVSGLGPRGLSMAQSNHSSPSMGYNEYCQQSECAPAYRQYASDREKKEHDVFLACRPDTAIDKKVAIDIVQLAGHRSNLHETARARRVFFPDIHTTMGGLEKNIVDFINSNIKTLTPTENPVDDTEGIAELIRLETNDSHGLTGYYIFNFTDLKTIDLDALTN